MRPPGLTQLTPVAWILASINICMSTLTGKQEEESDSCCVPLQEARAKSDTTGKKTDPWFFHQNFYFSFKKNKTQFDKKPPSSIFKFEFFKKTPGNNFAFSLYTLGNKNVEYK